MRAHDQGADTQHAVAVGERDERDGGEVVDQHDVEILEAGGGLNTQRTNRIKRVQRVTVVTCYPGFTRPTGYILAWLL